MRDWIGDHAAGWGVGSLVFFWVVAALWFAADAWRWWRRR